MVKSTTKNVQKVEGKNFNDTYVEVPRFFEVI
jgi:hypothetical protein